ncbi:MULTISPECIES: MFS transporter [Kitasatospora]|uniref:EmrB/QacA subfamily drug resistance transporter n=2 Tax=Kitasatospora TaxID=2063 RepID=A0ABT1IT03_9ACTN|nr:MFS transporter [Kitasatospora paracochleata]MCP2308268.1 EmrB/QacA subfamily drug resistance transporter [Kitasatospora paracochleata]
MTALPAAATTVRTRSRGIMMAVLGCCFLVVMMDNTILNVALQTIQRDLNATNSELQWSVDSYILVYAALMFSAGVLADSFGRRRTLLIGMIVFGVASGFSAFATSPEQLILWRAVMGIGGAVVPPATLAIINDTSAPEERGKAIGVWSAIGGLSIALGPIIGGFLLEHYWWGSVFLINIPVVVVCALLMLGFVPESRAVERPRLDAAGVLLSIVGTGALVYGVIRGGETSDWLGPEVLGSLIGGLALLVLLVRVESRAASPALDVSLLRNPAFTAGTTGISLSFFALTGGTFLLVFYVQGVRGYTPLELGLLLLPVAVGTIVSAILSGGLAKKHGPRLVVAAGLVLMTASFLWMAVLGRTTAIWQLEGALALSGLGLGLVMGTTTTVIMAVVPADKSAVGAAVNNTLRQVGAALGVATLGSVLSVRYRADLGGAADILPAGLRDEARDSLGGTLGALEKAAHQPAVIGPIHTKVPQLILQADDAYLSAMHVTVIVAAALLIVALLVVLRWLPARLPES